VKTPNEFPDFVEVASSQESRPALLKAKAMLGTNAYAQQASLR